MTGLASKPAWHEVSRLGFVQRALSAAERQEGVVTAQTQWFEQWGGTKTLVLACGAFIFAFGNVDRIYGRYVLGPDGYWVPVLTATSIRDFWIRVVLDGMVFLGAVSLTAWSSFQVAVWWSDRSAWVASKTGVTRCIGATVLTGGAAALLLHSWWVVQSRTILQSNTWVWLSGLSRGEWAALVLAAVLLTAVGRYTKWRWGEWWSEPPNYDDRSNTAP